ncbi:Peptidoglycan/LPS O-acetylase OafA/YrhL, contains acyltransferase and SGNH-hydrolase domains [Lentzea albidocapillata subsp. violacea]|uniref:Peptidoglycan/LPS O-acetylase OafA/YrhL, contains acyltransferase and SGNH-hydrolase domains n=1 Tax=Lentzea albidocapillata subsp. violacea TaxID=128104 RepID=A0A1G8Q167_9PSEU|nr:acyltransferase [Lentzea albidocapillata]SDI98494.1 Peptidoglycan/LPS O-acetylase OafA/YrhL, contains acyltransferase and SGNH-hydrolase domains [Lentzea albidocapillata subsp. violacea]
MRRIAGLDVLRGIAILLVMLRHAFPEVFPGAGVVGVVVFFTLSGYLITGVLQRELTNTGRVDFKRFYLRRARRLLPALIALTLIFAVVTLVFDPLGERDKLLRTVIVLVTFTGNLPISGVSPAAFHGWTLATEEQFYLLWPALLAFAWVRNRTGAVLVVTALGALAACTATLVWLWPNADNAYALPTSWFVCFVIGAATRLRLTTAPRWAVPVALTGLAVLSVAPLRGHALTYLVAGPAIAACTAVLLLVWSKWERVATPIRPLVALGVLSYGAYLWNYPLTLWLRPELGAAAGPVAAVLTIVAAALSWRYVEEPVMRRGERSLSGRSR